MDDLSAYVSAYLDEAAEHLRELQGLVPSLARSDVRLDDVHAAFRAMHSIKGGAAIFGQATMADIAHVSEHLLDALRKGARAATEDESDALNQALEALEDVIAALRRGETPERGGPQRAIERLAVMTGQTAGLARHDPADFPGLAESALLPFTPAAGAADDDAGGFGFFVPPGGGAVAAPEADYLQDALLGGAEFFVILPGELEPDTGLPMLTPMPDRFASPKAASTLPAPASAPARAAIEPPLPSGPLSSGQAPMLPADTVRVASARLDGLLELASGFSQLYGQLEDATRHDYVLRQRVDPVLDQFERMTRELHSAVMALRLVPLNFAFSRLTRLVREVSAQLGKPAQLALRGADTEVDKALVERLSDPLMHLVRNSLDHGIEQADVRRALGKPEHGQLVLSAEQRAGQVVIALEDDGAGLSRSRILERAHALGIALAEDASDEAVWQCIFEPGFSTTASVNAMSGRGVGLDVVRQTLQGLGGRVRVTSRAGKGARFELRLPLTLAVLDGMLVTAGGDHYLLPVAVVQESMDARTASVHTVAGGREAISLHGRPIPVYRLENLYASQSGPIPPVLMVIADEAGTYALAVDELHGQHSAVVKGLEGRLRGLPGVTGSTVVGAGRTALILDPQALPGLIRQAGAQHAPPPAGPGHVQPKASCDEIPAVSTSTLVDQDH